jgi:hypothetical protein
VASTGRGREKFGREKLRGEGFSDGFDEMAEKAEKGVGRRSFEYGTGIKPAADGPLESPWSFSLMDSWSDNSAGRNSPGNSATGGTSPGSSYTWFICDMK